MAASRIPAGAGHRRDQGGEPAGHRCDPRRPRHHRVGRDLGRMPGQLPGDHPSRRVLPGRPTARPSPFGLVLPGYEALPEAERHARAAELFPLVRGLASTDRPQVGHYTDSDVVLDFLARAEHPRLAALGTSCPDHFLRTKVSPARPRPPGRPRPWRRSRPVCSSCTPPTVRATPPTTSATPTPDSPAMRGADPAIVLVPGVGMFSFGANKQTARVAGEFYVNAINVMRGAESVSTYAPIDEAGEVPHRVLGAGGGQAAADAQAQAPGHPGGVRDRRRLRHRRGDRPPAGRRGRLRGRRRPDLAAAQKVAAELGRGATCLGRGDRGRGRRDQRGRHRRRAGRRRCWPSAAST